MVKGIFKRGYSAVEEEKKRQEEEKAKRSNGLFRFFLKEDGEEADIIFLTEEPINFYEHNIKTIVNGKERYEQVLCSGEDCPYCNEGQRPSFKGAYLIVDRREYTYKDKNGNEVTGENQIRLFVQGTKVLSQLERISKKYGLANREMTIVRLGKGTQTSYTLEKGDELDLSPEDIEELLNDNLKSIYNGDMESLYTIIENQLTSSIDTNNSTKTEESYDETLVSEDKPKKPSKLRLGKSKREHSLKKYLRNN